MPKKKSNSEAEQFKAFVKAAANREKTKEKAVTHAKRQIEQWERYIRLANTKLKTWKRKLTARERALREFKRKLKEI
jgi:predicted  nucleic acid-binding Zn-ribbon protein